RFPPEIRQTLCRARPRNRQGGRCLRCRGAQAQLPRSRARIRGEHQEVKPGMGPDVVRRVADLRARALAWRKAGESVGLVPTLGSLHEGHLTLVRAAKKENSRAVATLFVNPTQFGPNEDLAAYPRDEAADRRLLGEARADLLFAPDVGEMYSERFATTV